MRSILNPVGPEESSIYWRRRAIVLVVLSVVLWTGWAAVSAAIGSSGDPAPEAPSPTPSFGLPLAAGVGEDEQGAGDADDTPSPESVAVPSPTPGAPCTDAQLDVRAEVDAAETAVGRGLGLTLTVTNASEAACSRDVGAGANELRVTGASTLVWSSDHCNPSDARTDVLLEPGESWSTTMAWPGVASREGCPDAAAAEAGSYEALARNGTVESEPVTFEVR